MGNQKKFLRDKDVAERYGTNRTTVWRWVKTDPSFPRPVPLSPGCSRWPIEGLEAWERSKASRTA